jgi:hypothetical protein
MIPEKAYPATFSGRSIARRAEESGGSPVSANGSREDGPLQKP